MVNMDQSEVFLVYSGGQGGQGGLSSFQFIKVHLSSLEVDSDQSQA